ncbi:MAG TPA: hypothetical protein VGH87_09245 [Polyangiaceae bacterium]|jgi:hypothetical protein|nr:hypothetical protein [Polyangiaceae bacterium]
MGRRTGIVNVVAIGLVLTSAAVYAMNMVVVAPSVGVALAMLLGALLLASRDAPSSDKQPRVQLAASAVVVTLALGTVFVVGSGNDRPLRILRDLAWSEAGLGVWMTYSALLSLSFTRRLEVAFDDTSRARWREGDVTFGVDLARSIVVRAQPSWAALVVETAWPEPRPEAVEELVKIASTAPSAEVASLKEKMQGKGGTAAADARWELARIACDVVLETRGRDSDDVGGASAGRFIVQAAKAVRDDEDANRIFSALVLPAVARRA